MQWSDLGVTPQQVYGVVMFICGGLNALGSIVIYHFLRNQTEAYRKPEVFLNPELIKAQITAHLKDLDAAERRAEEQRSIIKHGYSMDPPSTRMPEVNER